MRWLLLFGGLFVASCGSDQGYCGQIGCFDVFRVGVSTLAGPLSSFSGSIVGDGARYEFKCPETKSGSILCGRGFVSLFASPV